MRINMKNHSISLKFISRVFLVATTAILILATVAFAGATWLSTNGPTWDGSSWVLTGTATISSPHHHVCMTLSVPDGPNAGTHTVQCSALGNFTCTVDGNSVASSTSPITWSLFAASSSGCGGNTTTGSPPTGGQFGPTGPTSITLSGLNATTIAPVNWFVIVLLVGFTTLIVVFALHQRNLQ